MIFIKKRVFFVVKMDKDILKTQIGYTFFNHKACYISSDKSLNLGTCRFRVIFGRNYQKAQRK